MNFNARFPTLNPSPSRQMVVADPKKVSFFAQAAQSRFGMQNSAGALGYIGAVHSDPTIYEGVVPPNNSAATNTMKDVATVAGTFLSNLLGQQPAVAPPPPVTPVPPDDTILGLPPAVVVIAGVGVAAFIGWKLLKK